jgi:hypothetical protein
VLVAIAKPEAHLRLSLFIWVYSKKAIIHAIFEVNSKHMISRGCMGESVALSPMCHAQVDSIQ